MIDQNFKAKVLIRLILHDESYTSKACRQHNPAVHVEDCRHSDVHPGKERLGAGQPDPSLRASTRVVMVGLLPVGTACAFSRCLRGLELVPIK